MWQGGGSRRLVLKSGMYWPGKVTEGGLTEIWDISVTKGCGK